MDLYMEWIEMNIGVNEVGIIIVRSSVQNMRTPNWSTSFRFCYSRRIQKSH